MSIQLCAVDTDCPQGESCVGGGLGGAMFCYTVPDGGFQRRDGGGAVEGGGGGEDSSTPTEAGSSGGDSSTADGPSE
jgi:hypothetical protein